MSLIDLYHPKEEFSTLPVGDVSLKYRRSQPTGKGLNQKQFDAHWKGVGGSVLGSVLDLKTAYKSRRQLWDEYVMPESRDDLSTNLRVISGIYQEDAVANILQDVSGFELISPTEPFHHPEHDWMVANPDRLFKDDLIVSDGVSEKPCKVGVEIKTRSIWAQNLYGDEFTDEVQVAEIFQCQWYMEVLDYDYWVLCVLIDNVPKIYTLTRSKKLASKLVAEAKIFWESVKTLTPPPPSRYSDLLDNPTSTEVLVADNETRELYDEIVHVRSQIKRHRSIEEDLKTKLALKIASNEELIDVDGTLLATFKKIRNKRQLRIRS